MAAQGPEEGLPDWIVYSLIIIFVIGTAYIYLF